MVFGLPTRVMATLLLILTMAAAGCSQGDLTHKTDSSVQKTGVRVAAADIQQLLPETVGQGKPVIVDFYSQFCLACQQLKPKLEKLTAKHPELTVVRLDVQNPRPEDEPVIKAFKATTVPYVAFIDGQGHIHKELLEDVPVEELEAAALAIIKPSPSAQAQ